MIAAGLGIPIMAALNGGLATKIQSPALAATILLSVGLFFCRYLSFNHRWSSFDAISQRHAMVFLFRRVFRNILCIKYYLGRPSFWGIQCNFFCASWPADSDEPY